MLQDPKLREAVSKIVQRSERQEDVQRLVGTYVDVGLLPQLDNVNHQVLYGRRGTGKTHVLKVLESRLVHAGARAVVYIDCRTLGSTSQFGDLDLPMRTRCLALFRDILLAMYHGLLEHIIEHPSDRGEEALTEIDHLQKLITEPLQHVRPEAVSAEQTGNSSSKGGLEINVSSSPAVKASLSSSTESINSSTTKFSITSEEKIIFPELQRALSRVLDLAACQLVLIIDEWSSLPRDVQPYLAEFLKRGLLPLQRATLKIGALEHRSSFQISAHGRLVGFELGADIATAPDLDDYFVYDRNP